MKVLLVNFLAFLTLLVWAGPFEPLIKAAPAGKTDLFEKSEPSSPFVMIGSGKQAEPTTIVKAAFDAENIYFQFTMRDYKSSDSFEVFLAGENKNPENKKSDRISGRIFSITQSDPRRRRTGIPPRR